MNPFRVLVIGDIMIDRYTYCRSTRQAQEALMPVWDEASVEHRLGGAANVAHNLKALGKDDVDVHLAGIIGNHEYGTTMARLAGVNTDMCVGQSTMLKHRYVDQETMRYLLRVDNIRRFPDDDVEFFELLLDNYVFERRFDAVIISDYDKGTVDVRGMELARKSPLVVVDSKRRDLRIFEGANVLKVNEEEYSLQASSKDYINFERMFGNVVVTRSPRPADVRRGEYTAAELRICEVTKSNDRRYVTHSIDFKGKPVEAKDVTGCGDTHTAAMTFGLLKTGDIAAAIRLANTCAASVVQKFGTATV